MRHESETDTTCHEGKEKIMREITERVLVALITPFLEDGSIDYESLRILIEKLIFEGCDGFVIAGTTGEAACLTYEERKEICQYTMKIVRNRAKVWLGCGTNNTKTSLSYIQLANELQPDGIMLITPYYNKPTQEGMYAHFSVLAEATDLPIMLYNVPSRTAVNLSVQTVIALNQKYPHICTLKQANSRFDEVKELLYYTDMKVYSGEDGLLLEGLQSGMTGIVSVIGHLYLTEIRKVIFNHDYGVLDTDTDNFLKRMTSLFFIETSPSPVKYILSKKGYCKPILRLPLVEVSEENKQILDEQFHFRSDKKTK